MSVQSIPKRSWIFFFFKPLPRSNCFLLTRPLPDAVAAEAATPRFFGAGLAAVALWTFSAFSALGASTTGFAGAGAAGFGAATFGADAGFFASLAGAALPSGFLAAAVFGAGAAFVAGAAGFFASLAGAGFFAASFAGAGAGFFAASFATAGFGFVSAGLAAFSTFPFAGLSAAFVLSAVAFGFSFLADLAWNGNGFEVMFTLQYKIRNFYLEFLQIFIDDGPNDRKHQQLDLMPVYTGL